MVDDDADDDWLTTLGCWLAWFTNCGKNEETTNGSRCCLPLLVMEMMMVRRWLGRLEVLGTWPVEPATAYRGNDNNGDDVVLQVKITTLLYCFSAQFLAKGRPNGWTVWFVGSLVGWLNTFADTLAWYQDQVERTWAGVSFCLVSCLAEEVSVRCSRVWEVWNGAKSIEISSQRYKWLWHPFFFFSCCCCSIRCVWLDLGLRKNAVYQSVFSSVRLSAGLNIIQTNNKYFL